MADFVSLRLKDPAHRTKFSKALRYVSCASFCMAIITRLFCETDETDVKSSSGPEISSSGRSLVIGNTASDGGRSCESVTAARCACAGRRLEILPTCTRNLVVPRRLVCAWPGFVE